MGITTPNGRNLVQIFCLDTRSRRESPLRYRDDAARR